jgi:hypothetical protein
MTLLSLVGDFLSWKAVADLHRDVNGIQRKGRPLIVGKLEINIVGDQFQRLVGIGL